MTELPKRVFAGSIYITLVLISIYLGSWAFDLLFLIFLIICIYEFAQFTSLNIFYLYTISTLLWMGLLFIDGLKEIFLGLSVVLNLGLIYFLFLEKKMFVKLQKSLLGIFYINAGIFFFNKLPYVEGALDKYLVLGIFILVWMNDSMAYFIGKRLGRRKLFPSASPNKTIEGFLGGGVAVLLTASVFSTFLPETGSSLRWYVMAVIIVVFGTFGDLIESKFKRSVGIKDSGRILPGHGGLLDRLDGSIFMSPFLYIAIQLL